jgi:hypothetical protein
MRVAVRSIDNDRKRRRCHELKREPGSGLIEPPLVSSRRAEHESSAHTFAKYSLRRCGSHRSASSKTFLIFVTAREALMEETLVLPC